MASDKSHMLSKLLQAQSSEAISQSVVSAQVSAIENLVIPHSEIARAARIQARTYTSGGRIFFSGSGASAMAILMDSSEIARSYGLQESRFLFDCVGPIPLSSYLLERSEDDVNWAETKANRIGHGDCVIAVSSSGSTPYTLRYAEVARRNGADVISLSSNQEGGLSQVANLPILIETGTELICGSSRLSSGTAQKIILNALSICFGVELGAVYNGHLVNLKMDNAKLRYQGIRTIAYLADVSLEAAEEALKFAGNIKLAILMLKLGFTLDEAQARLDATGGNLAYAIDNYADINLKNAPLCPKAVEPHPEYYSGTTTP